MKKEPVFIGWGMVADALKKTTRYQIFEGADGKQYYKDESTGKLVRKDFSKLKSFLWLNDNENLIDTAFKLNITVPKPNETGFFKTGVRLLKTDKMLIVQEYDNFPSTKRKNTYTAYDLKTGQYISKGSIRPIGKVIDKQEI